MANSEPPQGWPTVSSARSPFSFLVVAIAAGLLVTWLQNHSTASATGTVNRAADPADACSRAMGDKCDERVTIRSAVDEVVLDSEAVCVDVGYLCADLETSGSQRILRWPESTGRLRIRVPLPQGVSPERARDLQSAAVRGIQYWQRRPFELVIDTHPIASREPDVEISWGEGLSGSQLGLTQVRWSLEKGKVKFEVLGIALAMLSPQIPNFQLPPQQVLLTAAHEMGHALGLSHSDSERDVMYPTNTSRSLSTRDFRTIGALYRLPNGAEIVKGP